MEDKELKKICQTISGYPEVIQKEIYNQLKIKFEDSTFKEIQKLFKSRLQDIAKDLDYPEDTICVLSGEEQRLASEYPDTYQSITTVHHRDARTSFQYAMDLAASWIMEDYIINQLKIKGLSIERAGEDKERKMLSSKKISSNSDCKVLLNGQEIPLELVNDYKGYWAKNKKIDLRDDKYLNMVKKKSLLLGISTKDQKYILLNFAKDIKAKHIENHYAYHKPAYSIPITPDMLKDLDFSAIAEVIAKEL